MGVITAAAAGAGTGTEIVTGTGSGSGHTATTATAATGAAHLLTHPADSLGSALERATVTWRTNRVHALPNPKPLAA